MCPYPIRPVTLEEKKRHEDRHTGEGHETREAEVTFHWPQPVEIQPCSLPSPAYGILQVWVCFQIPPLAFFFSFFFFFLRPHPQHTEAPRLGGRIQAAAAGQTTATATLDPSRICDLHGSL